MKRILFIALIAALLSDIFVHIFNYFFDLPQQVFVPLGRWVIGFQKGNFYIDNIYAAPSYPHELVVGVIIHLLVSLIFASSFIMLLRYFLGFEHDLRDGMIYGLLLMVFPLLFEMPAMGLGYFGMNMAHQAIVLTRLAGDHLIFGLGMGLGNELFNWIFAKKNMN